MRTSEIVDLQNERRLSAVLDFTSAGGELLILNGGSRAQELVVIIETGLPLVSEVRSAYCVDSGTSLQLFIPVEPLITPDAITLRIVGDHGEMVLGPPRKRVPRSFGLKRAAVGLLAATLSLLFAAGRVDSPSLRASADPEPASVEAPLVRPALSLHVPALLPRVDRAPIRHVTIAARSARTSDRHLPAAVALATVPTVKAIQPETPAPMMTDLRVPTTAKSGDFIPVSFGAVARQVKIVASIGPTIVSKTIIGAQRGVIAIRSPKSDLDSRVMTVRAYAQDGKRSSTLQAMVILVRP